MNMREIIDELEILESKAGWPPNRKMYRRALVALGQTNKWGVEPLGYYEAIKKMNEEKKKVGQDRWELIADAIKEVEDKRKISSTVVVQSANVEKVEGVQLSGRAVSKYERENDNLRKTIDQKNREIGNLIEAAKSHKCGICEKTKLQAISDANIQANALADKDVEINNMREKIKALSASFGELKTNRSINDKMEAKYEQEKDRANRLAGNYDNAMKEVRRLEKLYEEASAVSVSDESDVLRDEIYKLKSDLYEEQQKRGKIDFQTAVSGLMSGRVLEPEVGSIGYLSDKDKKELLRFSATWEGVMKSFPNVSVYGMKNAESDILKRRGINIDDYGQAICDPKNEDFMRVLAYMDSAVSHAIQELQGAYMMADKLLKGGS